MYSPPSTPLGNHDQRPGRKESSRLGAFLEVQSIEARIAGLLGVYRLLALSACQQPQERRQDVQGSEEAYLAWLQEVTWGSLKTKSGMSAPEQVPFRTLLPSGMAVTPTLAVRITTVTPTPGEVHF